MTFSYLSSGPNSSDRSYVRLKLADNTTDNIEFQDEEIDLLLADEGSKERASIAGARAIAARYARRASKKIGRLSIDSSKIADAYFKLAEQLEAGLGRRAGGTEGIYAGGISRSDKLTEEQDEDRVDPTFARGQFDNPRTADNLDDRLERSGF